MVDKLCKNCEFDRYGFSATHCRDCGDGHKYFLEKESIRVEKLVSPTEPTQPQQVFTIEEVKGWLKQQRANCASAFMDYGDYAYIKQNTKETISTLKRDEIFNAPEPKIIRTI